MHHVRARPSVKEHLVCDPKAKTLNHEVSYVDMTEILLATMISTPWVDTWLPRGKMKLIDVQLTLQSPYNTA